MLLLDYDNRHNSYEDNQSHATTTPPRHHTKPTFFGSRIQIPSMSALHDPEGEINWTQSTTLTLMSCTSPKIDASMSAIGDLTIWQHVPATQTSTPVACTPFPTPKFVLASTLPTDNGRDDATTAYISSSPHPCPCDWLVFL